MKQAIIFAHPDPESFTASVAQAYGKAAAGLGHTVLQRNLYGLGFDPRLKAEELLRKDGPHPAADVREERALLKDADVFVLVYPLWLNAPPAIMKGYLERVFGFGFAYGDNGHSSTPLLVGRKLVTISASGAPAQWLRESGAFDALHKLFVKYFSELCGLIPLEHLHLGGIVPGASEFYINARLAEVTATVGKHFGRAA